MQASHPVPEGGGCGVDTGVYEGGEIPMYYDSDDLQTHRARRRPARRGFQDARGAQCVRDSRHLQQLPFQAALLAHPKFVSGQFNTGFIAEEYPKGFTAASVKHEDPGFLLALAVAANRRVWARSSGISGQLRGHELQIAEDFVVVATDALGVRTETPARVRVDGPVFRVELGGAGYDIRFGGHLRDVAVHGELNNRPFSAQVERMGLAYRVMQFGAQVDVRVLSPRAAELYALMPFKAPARPVEIPALALPGLLVDVAVQAGQTVRAGEKLAVIEAMKMENILLAQRDAVIANVRAAKGESLSVDQVILEFAPQEAA